MHMLIKYVPVVISNRPDSSIFGIISEKYLKNSHSIENNKIYMINEKKEYELRSDKVNYLASRFASKEAYFKATQDIHYLGISILNDKNGKPYVLNKKNIHLSISDEDEYVIAYLIVEE